MEDPLLHIDHHLPGIGLIPASIELLRRKPKLDDQIPRQVLRLDLAPLLPPQPDQGLLVGAHDDPSVRATDKMPSLHRTPFPHLVFGHFASLQKRLPFVTAIRYY